MAKPKNHGQQKVSEQKETPNKKEPHKSITYDYQNATGNNTNPTFAATYDSNYTLAIPTRIPNDRKVLEMYLTGMSEPKIGKALYCSQQNVSKIIKRIVMDIADTVNG